MRAPAIFCLTGIPRKRTMAAMQTKPTLPPLGMAEDILSWHQSDGSEDKEIAEYLAECVRIRECFDAELERSGNPTVADYFLAVKLLRAKEQRYICECGDHTENPDKCWICKSTKELQNSDS